MAGYVSETRTNAPYKGESGLIKLNDYPFSPFSVREWRQSAVRFPANIYSFRSGPEYERSVRSGGVPFAQNLNELLAASGEIADTGHEFSLEKMESFHSSSSENITGFKPFGLPLVLGPNAIFQLRTWNGIFPPQPELDDYGFGTSDTGLKELGTRFISQTEPLRPQANLLQALGELIMDGLPMIIGKAILDPSLGKGRRARLRSLGEEHLNYQFGILPTIGDIRRIYSTIRRMDEIVSQWLRDDKRRVRRRRRQPRSFNGSSYDIPDTYLLSGNLSYALGGPDGLGNLSLKYIGYGVDQYDKLHASRQCQVTVEEDISFSSAFEYDLSKLSPGFLGALGDVDSSSEGTKDFLLRLHALGASPDDLSVSLLWELLPWSWLVDWFSNIGDVFDNFRALQTAGLQVNYAYITSVSHRLIYERSQLYTENPRQIGSFSYQSICRQKRMRRLKATPFGFNVSFNGLSAHQAGILAALAAVKGTN